MADSELIVYVYNKSFQLVAIMDRYSSMNWSDRYDECGVFELKLPYDSKYNKVFVKDYYCKIEYSDRWMIIEKVQIDQEEDSPAMMTVSGRSLESILERRIILEKAEFGEEKKEVSVQDSIKKLLTSNIISPKDSNRKISNFKFSASTDTAITKLKFSETYDKDELYSVIQGICQDKHIGFKIVLDASNNFVFSLFKGKDRSKSSNTTSYVVFSPYYDNLAI